MQHPPLQPLRIPQGWTVEYNSFHEIDPSDSAIRDMWLKDDLLQINHHRTAVLVDLGWYGQGDQSAFRLVAHQGDFHGRCLNEFHSRDRLEIVAKIEDWLAEYGVEPHPVE